MKKLYFWITDQSNCLKTIIAINLYQFKNIEKNWIMEKNNNLIDNFIHFNIIDKNNNFLEKKCHFFMYVPSVNCLLNLFHNIAILLVLLLYYTMMISYIIKQTRHKTVEIVNHTFSQKKVCTVIILKLTFYWHLSSCCSWNCLSTKTYYF